MLKRCLLLLTLFVPFAASADEVHVTTFEVRQHSESSSTQVSYQEWRPSVQLWDGTVLPGYNWSQSSQSQSSDGWSWSQRTEAWYPAWNGF